MTSQLEITKQCLAILLMIFVKFCSFQPFTTNYLFWQKQMRKAVARRPASWLEHSPFRTSTASYRHSLQPPVLHALGWITLGGE
ncbi:hypothetical protein ACOSP7_008780 [Xanthoceras sorbifolium]